MRDDVDHTMKILGDVGLLAFPVESHTAIYSVGDEL